MADWDVTEVKGHLEKLYSELDEINAEEKIKIEEVAKIRALHTAKLEEASYAGNDTAVGNDQPVDRIIEEDRGGAVAVCGADDDEDEDDEHGDEDEGVGAEDDEEDDSETGHGGRWSSGSDDGGGEYPAYDDDSGSADSDAYRRPSPTSFYDPWD
ncbi:acidic leucine-rich nuclear phosphoprotein 32 family member B-like [Chenopodium quinoa]|uniref:acidic leucine-rich nuclear phosphoprotein 32 family member B-like n=1 Tax=Chenopodium quinoa TaxID=63459 RepID=UPI000B799076|nr:acidic leucine-rich nuclear phosphoprotein 32 family member B-like [Chenopodium quinoa]